MTDISHALGRLYALAPRGARHGLDAMREACAREKDPQDALPVVHVAGTNGKGSVCAYVDAIARAAGLRTGLYTSPHLLRFAERIRIDGEPLDDDALARALTHVLDAYPELTFFEVATLAAFLAFREAKLDLVVLEVGLGGRLDATNVVQHPRATAITTIGFDHMSLLGDTLEKIAREKAGILKRGVTAVIGAMPDEARRAIEERANEIGAPLVHVAAVDTTDLRPSLAGAHQLHNAAIAAGLARLLNVDESAIRRGIAQTTWPGRLEEIARDDRIWLLDGAHNEEGALALANALDARGEMPSDRVLVFGAMVDKPWRAMLDHLAPRFGQRIYVEPMASGGGRPAAPAWEMKAHDALAEIAPDATHALRRAREIASKNGVIVVAGSLYLVGEARAALLDLPRDPQVGL